MMHILGFLMLLALAVMIGGLLLQVALGLVLVAVGVVGLIANKAVGWFR
jgi:hypothetical protein